MTSQIQELCMISSVLYGSRCRLKDFQIIYLRRFCFIVERLYWFGRGKDPTLVTLRDIIFCLSCMVNILFNYELNKYHVRYFSKCKDATNVSFWCLLIQFTYAVKRYWKIQINKVVLWTYILPSNSYFS